ncbi:broad substrate specificity ATP-binding cassette transporter ABCG2-like [Clarias gariepinus]
MVDLHQNGVSESKVITKDPITRQHGATVSFHNIQYTVTFKNRCCKKNNITKNVLMDLNGIMKPGLNAILGPTGCGKSSFLDVLAARKDPSGLSGEVLIDGAPQPSNFKCLSGYVVQDDIVMGTLTVRENLCFSAALRLSSSIKQKEKEARVNRLISELGLSEVANKRVGTQLIRGISGGERKRTSIGMEMIINPAVLFLDEPTTGLDASTASSVLLLLKQMANNGCNIIMSIHQPRYSIYQLFDNLTLLMRGKQVYHGPADDALGYFAEIGYICEAHNNPADFFLDVINGDSIAATKARLLTAEDLEFEESGDTNQGIENRLVEEYRKSKYAQETKAELEYIMRGKEYSNKPKLRTITYNTGFFHQLHWVIKRSFRSLVLNLHTPILQFATTIYVALIVGIIFFAVKNNQSGLQNRFGALYFLSNSQCFNSLTAVQLFITGRKLFIHEYISGYYRVSVYFLSKILSDMFILHMIPAVVLTCIVYFMIGLKDTPAAFFLLMFTLILVACTATSMTMAISVDHSFVETATVLINLTFVFMIIFSGLLVNLDSVVPWLAWLKYLSIPHYGLTALQINEFVGLTFCGNLTDVLMSNTTKGIICTGEQHLQSQGINYSTWGLWQNHVALIIMTIIFLITAYIKLRFMRKFS